jgi:hypothetical protein
MSLRLVKKNQNARWMIKRLVVELDSSRIKSCCRVGDDFALKRNPTSFDPVSCVPSRAITETGEELVKPW